MNHYYSGFDVVAAVKDDTLAPAQDPGGVCLPFGHLDWRDFEVLVYELKSLAHNGLGNSVTLNRGAKDKGKDIVVYLNRQLLEIAQCKHQRTVDDKVVIEEIAKIGLHHLKEPGIIGDRAFIYELWCTGSFSDKASVLIDTWPAQWAVASIKDTVKKLIKEYAAFKDFLPDDACDYLTSKFSSQIQPKKKHGIDITNHVKQNPSIHRKYFVANYLMDPVDVHTGIRDSMENLLMQFKYRPMNSNEAIDIVERINSFDQKERICFFSGYVFGLQPEFLAYLNEGEFVEFSKTVMGGIQKAAILLQKATIRRSIELINKNQSRLQYDYHAFRLLLVNYFRWEIFCLFKIGIPESMSDLDIFSPYRSKSANEKLEVHINRVWDTLTKAKDLFDPTVSPESSGQAVNSNMAVLLLAPHKNKETFIAAMKADFGKNREFVAEITSELKRLIPNQLMIIADSKTALELPDERRAAFQASMEVYDSLPKK